MESLRNEIIESQKMRIDLLKWKLILIAGIGSAAIGLTGKEPNDFDCMLLLCLLPLVNIYVDLMCRHLTLRILVIGKYLYYCHLNGKEPDAGHYETMADEARKLSLTTSFKEWLSRQNIEQYFLQWSAFGLEKGALTGSSYIISMLLIICAINGFMNSQSNDNQTSNIIFIAGTIGFLASILIDFLYLIRKCGIDLIPLDKIIKENS